MTPRQQIIFSLLYRPGGATLEEINDSVTPEGGARAWSYIRDATLIGKKVGKTVWFSGHGKARRFGLL